MTRRDYCTYFDHRYLPRGLTLCESLRRHSDDGFRLWVLCLTDEAFTLLESFGLPEVHPVRLAHLELFDPELLTVKDARSTVEYYFTLSPVWPRFLFATVPDLDLITYLDADLAFFSSPEPLYDEMGDAAVTVVEHRFPEALRSHLKFGRYNVGWVSFRRGAEAERVLAWWRDRCLEWCHDYPDDGRFADQAYLDEWPALCPSLHVLQHPGADVAPWNLGRHTVTTSRAGLLVDSRPLVFYHFHGVRQKSQRVFDLTLDAYGVRLSPGILNALYKPYLMRLRRHEASVPEAVVRDRDEIRTIIGGQTLGRGLRHRLDVAIGLLRRRYVAVGRN